MMNVVLLRVERPATGKESTGQGVKKMDFERNSTSKASLQGKNLLSTYKDSPISLTTDAGTFSLFNTGTPSKLLLSQVTCLDIFRRQLHPQAQEQWLQFDHLEGPSQHDVLQSITLLWCLNGGPSMQPQPRVAHSTPVCLNFGTD
ncbi:hypothetical protein HAX54_052261 [Datura stramonium]|uniref:Uncharacterized protein n=1 Tax=Datura stramonium TaxID=4076 RepID=A0ABS8SYP8_DATST|nr:hypothetical protein [Datura stramonium]